MYQRRETLLKQNRLIWQKLINKVFLKRVMFYLYILFRPWRIIVLVLSIVVVIIRPGSRPEPISLFCLSLCLSQGERTKFDGFVDLNVRGAKCLIEFFLRLKIHKISTCLPRFDIENLNLIVSMAKP